MKRIIIVICLLLLSGCSKKELIIGSWETSYEINGIGKIKEIYNFEKNNKCIRTIIIDSEINTDCTYEFNQDKTQIKILWDDKLYKDDYSNYEEINKNKIKIGNYTYTRKEVKNEK